MLAEKVGSSFTQRYVWSPVYVDAMVLRDRDTNADGTLDERLWVVQDANWNVTALVDGTGAVVERYAYDPYGARTVYDPNWNVRSGGSAYDFTQGFQGMFFDSVSGTNKSRGRTDYSPTLGRWIATDPIEFAAGDVNLYAFVGNEPANLTDPSGLQPQTIIGGNRPGNPVVGTKWIYQYSGAVSSGYLLNSATASQAGCGYVLSIKYNRLELHGTETRGEQFVHPDVRAQINDLMKSIEELRLSIKGQQAQVDALKAETIALQRKYNAADNAVDTFDTLIQMGAVAFIPHPITWTMGALFAGVGGVGTAIFRIARFSYRKRLTAATNQLTAAEKLLGELRGYPECVSAANLIRVVVCVSSAQHGGSHAEAI